MDREAKNKYQKEWRIKNNNSCTKKYEKTKKGFLVRLYRNMKSRVEGIQKKNLSSYLGKSILDKQVFYDWALSNEDYHRLFIDYENSGFDRKKAPSVDRINPKLGYDLDNIQFITMSKNCSKDSLKVIYQYDKQGNLINRFNSINEAAISIHINPSSITLAASDRYPYSKTAGGYVWSYNLK